ncbi:type II toxin-antitoxin system RelE/ParE family toxin [Castellaniella sp. S9]|uniref:type II toxin-antitoxin system RelE/ParE family toxin n=1 Tax=Castellaniella sp. S9 TaxID=2993652 RepID=UPI0022B4306D|nr:type II toxin-antitoxin system RelE/ParE family toxin [Castellaniella sp. S9]
MRSYRLTASAQGGLIDIFAWAHEHFGEQARFRYESLILTALRDIAAAPERVGSIERPELGEGIRSWHVRLSQDRGRTPSGIVRRPRHFLIYRLESDVVVIGRVLYDGTQEGPKPESGPFQILERETSHWIRISLFDENGIFLSCPSRMDKIMDKFWSHEKAQRLLQTKILSESVNLVHPGVEDRHDTNVVV